MHRVILKTNLHPSDWAHLGPLDPDLDLMVAYSMVHRILPSYWKGLRVSGVVVQSHQTFHSQR
jgi:hypothetical protein